MSAVEERANAALDAAPQRARAWTIAVPAAISVVTFIFIELALVSLVGQPWGPTYPVTMDALILARMGPLFFSGLIVWPAMRARGATRWQALLGVWSTPIAFAVVSAWRAADFFPPLEAAYYATNPMVVGAFGAQLSSAGVGALAWALWRARRWSWPAFTGAIIGIVVAVVAVLWDGGQHLFYPWLQVYGQIFG